MRRAAFLAAFTSVLLIGAAAPAGAAEKGAAEDNWPAPLIALLVVAIALVIAGIAYMLRSGRGDGQGETG
ncbi:MAG: hypothetical protein ACR2IR_11235 [Acidimicrobiia bacterium]